VPGTDVQRPLLTRGFVEQVVADGDSTIVVGWCHGVDAFVLERFRAFVGEAEHDVLEARLHEASPDIAREITWCARAERARLVLRLPVARRALPRHALLTAVPVAADGRRGLGIHTVVDPAVARPTAASIDSIGGGYEFAALEWLGLMTELGGLPRDGTVLDVGCGIGRMAYGLSAWLGFLGAYVGLEIMTDAVATARSTFAAFPRLRFEHIDVRNAMYNPRGALTTAAVRFAEHATGVDLVLMTSVATHLPYGEFEHYLRQARSVLQPDGRVLVSAFVLDDETEWLARTRPDVRRFVHHRELDCWVADPANPLGAVGIPLPSFQALVQRAGLRLDQLHPGAWSGRRPWLSYQDVAVLRPE